MFREASRDGPEAAGRVAMLPAGGGKIGRLIVDALMFWMMYGRLVFNEV